MACFQEDQLASQSKRTAKAEERPVRVPPHLAAACEGVAARSEWFKELPDSIRGLERRWSLSLGDPFDGEEISCAWVAPVKLSDGTSAVLKLGMPHMEGEHEIEGLRFWDGDPTVRLLKFDAALGAMLLERCEPGIHLRTLPETEQDVVIAGLMRRMWRLPRDPHPFRPLSEMIAAWSDETLSQEKRWADSALVSEGLRLFKELTADAPREALLATDLHAGNVLRAKREPWLVIDPKPFVGDSAYDATQHLFNCEARMGSRADETIRRFSDLLEINPERVRLWIFARAAAEPRSDWGDERMMKLARATAP
jgi:streptomycin 6-kinase